MVGWDVAFEALEQTSRTFSIPIGGLPPDLREAVASAYLCLRAIDEIEDHDTLPVATKVRLLTGVSGLLQSGVAEAEFKSLWDSEPGLPKVTTDLPLWLELAPVGIAPRIWDATAAMADRMAAWAQRGWRIRTASDLDGYTFSVAGAVGVLLCDLWAWHDGTQTLRAQAVGFGRGLQATNIVLNRAADLARNADFYPDGWSDSRMIAYAQGNLRLAADYESSLPPGPIRQFCSIPLRLARASLDARAIGHEKLTRAEVGEIVAQCVTPS